MNIVPKRSLKNKFITALVTAVVVLIVGFLVKAGGSFEMPLSEALNSLHHGIVGTLGNMLYKGIGPTFAIAGMVVITAIILIVTKSIPKASTFAVTVAVTWLSVAVVKLLVDRPRPDASMLDFVYHPIQIDASYPSGHMAFTSALVVTTFLMVGTVAAKRTVAIVGGFVMLCVALLLTIDAVHYPTDVLASMAWVIGVAPFVYTAWKNYALPWLLEKLHLSRLLDR